MPDPRDQLALFSVDSDPSGGARLPEGWEYRPDFLDAEEEAELLDFVSTLPLDAARYKATPRSGGSRTSAPTTTTK